MYVRWGLAIDIAEMFNLPDQEGFRKVWKPSNAEHASDLISTSSEHVANMVMTRC